MWPLPGLAEKGHMGLSWPPEVLGGCCGCPLEPGLLLELGALPNKASR